MNEIKNKLIKKLTVWSVQIVINKKTVELCSEFDHLFIMILSLRFEILWDFDECLN